MPRIGIAYRINDKTVIRAGAGTFFARLVGGMLDDVYTGNGIYQISDNLSNATLIAQGPVFPNALAGAADQDHVGRFHAGCPVAQTEDAVFRTGHHCRRAAARQRHGAYGFRNLQPRSQSLRHAGYQRSGAGRAFHLHIDGGRRERRRHLHDSGLLRARARTPNFGAIYEETNGVSSWYDGLVDHLSTSGFPTDSSRRHPTPGPTKSTTGRARRPTRSSDSAMRCGPITDNTASIKAAARSTSASASSTHLCGRRRSRTPTAPSPST